jgi:type IV secretory pathway VirD2 relaxase
MMSIASQTSRKDYRAILHPMGGGRTDGLKPITLSLLSNFVSKRMVTGRSKSVIVPDSNAQKLRGLQQSVVKASYIKNGYNSQWKAHGKYLEREGAQQEGERGTGFGSSGNEISVSDTLSQWQESGDRHLFKFIVSPEHADRMNMREHVEKLMECMERDLCVKLQWVAMDHHNTDNPHAHIALRGKDNKGNDLIIPKRYLSHGIRERSQEIATRELGKRTERDIERSREKNLQAKRVTELDRILEKRIDRDSKIVVSATGTVQQNNLDRQLLSRLQFLREIGLSKKVGSLTWQMQENFLSTLRQYQISQDIIKRRAQHMSHVMDTRSAFKQTSWQELKESAQPITGRLVGVGLENSLKDGRYMMLEATDGRIHYVSLPQNVNYKFDKYEMRAGDLITLRSRSFESDAKDENKKTVKYVAVEASGKWNDAKIKPLDYHLIEKLRLRASPLIQGSGLSAFQEHFNKLTMQRMEFMRAQGIVKLDGSVNEKAWAQFRQSEHHVSKDKARDDDRGR